MSVIGPVQSHYHDIININVCVLPLLYKLRFISFFNKRNDDIGKRNLRWEGFVEKVGFEPAVKERRSDG